MEGELQPKRPGAEPGEPPATLTDQDRVFIQQMRTSMRRMNRLAKRLAQDMGFDESHLAEIMKVMVDPDLMREVEAEESRLEGELEIEDMP